MKTTVLQEVIAFIFGRKYYVNIINTRGISKCEACSYIFRSKESARKHKQTIMSTHSFEFIETVSFRSREEYADAYESSIKS